MRVGSRMFKLCYLGNNFVFFTTAPLEEQWGDDWDDAPYEHNAGEPYVFREGIDKEEWKILKLAFEADRLVEPNHGHVNSLYSVQDINRGKVPWLRGWLDPDSEPVNAGDTVKEFVRKVEKALGSVYYPKDFDLSLLD